MRHAKGYRRLNRTHEHRKALFANMAGSLIEHEQIKTTLPKAKELRPIMEKMITLAKRGDLHARRQAASKLKQEQYVAKLFEILGPRYKDRQHSMLMRLAHARQWRIQKTLSSRCSPLKARFTLSYTRARRLAT